MRYLVGVLVWKIKLKKKKNEINLIINIIKGVIFNPYLSFRCFNSESSPMQSSSLACGNVEICLGSTRATLALGHRNRKFGSNDLPHLKKESETHYSISRSLK